VPEARSFGSAASLLPAGDPCGLSARRLPATKAEITTTATAASTRLGDAEHGSRARLTRRSSDGTCHQGPNGVAS